MLHRWDNQPSDPAYNILKIVGFIKSSASPSPIYLINARYVPKIALIFENKWKKTLNSSYIINVIKAVVLYIVVSQTQIWALFRHKGSHTRYCIQLVYKLRFVDSFSNPRVLSFCPLFWILCYLYISLSDSIFFNFKLNKVILCWVIIVNLIYSSVTYNKWL